MKIFPENYDKCLVIKNGSKKQVIYITNVLFKQQVIKIKFFTGILV